MAISVDDVEQNRAFAEAEKFGFPLLSDPLGRVAAQYGVFEEEQARRVSFAIDEKGIVRHVDAKITLTEHGRELAERIRALKRAAEVPR